jgi:hypothetical protein
MMRSPYSLKNKLTDGGEIVSYTPALLYSPETSFSVCGTYFCFTRLRKTQGLVQLERLGTENKIKRPQWDSNLLPSACSTVQPKKYIILYLIYF